MSRVVARDGGFALLIVLWTVVLLALLAMQITSAGRSEAQLTFNLRTAATLEAAADGALNEGIFHALDASRAHWRADGAAHVARMPGSTIEIVIENEAGKVNLNTAPPELLAALMRAEGADTRTAVAVAAAIADWRYPDAQRAGGAKTAAYQAAGRPYAPPGEPFRSLDELGLVLGMTPALQARIAPHLTIYHEGAPEAAVADPVVRQALQQATGTPAPSSPDVTETVVTITATARTPEGGRFVRRATVRLGQAKGGALFQVLTWEQL